MCHYFTFIFLGLLSFFYLFVEKAYCWFLVFDQVPLYLVCSLYFFLLFALLLFVSASCSDVKRRVGYDLAKLVCFFTPTHGV